MAAYEKSEGRSVYSVLAEVQHRVTCPKGKENKFGGYKYRSLEDINAALKPICEELRCGYIFTDQIMSMRADDASNPQFEKAVGNDSFRWYLKATITFWAEGCSSTVSTSAFAREAWAKKGMDDAQITGLASSYARKYAACGLFAIDSGEDPDQLDNSTQAYDKGQTRSKRGAQKEKPADADHLNALTDAMGEFAVMRGKSVTEVLEALCATESMKKLGVKPEQKEWTERQCDAAIDIVCSWINKAPVRKE